RHTRWPRDWSSDVCSSDLFQDAEQELRSSLARQETLVALQALGFTLNYEEKYSDAVPPLERARDLSPANYQTWEYLGMAYRHLKDRKSTRLNSSHVAISYA